MCIIVVTPGNLESAHYLGKCYGLVGKIQFFSGIHSIQFLLSKPYKHHTVVHEAQVKSLILVECLLTLLCVGLLV